MNHFLERVRCKQCKYPLLGQRMVNDRVACPECGTWVTLAALGVTETELIPPSANDASTSTI